MPSKMSSLLLKKLHSKNKPKPEQYDNVGMNQQEAIAWAKASSVPMYSLVDLENNEVVWQDELELEQDLNRRGTGSTTSSASSITSGRSY